MNDEEQITVLVVDDEERLVGLFAKHLESDYDVRTATTGEEALEQVDDEVDVILLDRRMPGMSGDRVLDELIEEDVDAIIGFLTAVDPGRDILDMPVDGYLIKPITMEDLRDFVDTLLQRSTGDERQREYYRLLAKLEAVEQSRISLPELRSELTDQYNDLRANLDVDVDDPGLNTARSG